MLRSAQDAQSHEMDLTIRCFKVAVAIICFMALSFIFRETLSKSQTSHRNLVSCFKQIGLGATEAQVAAILETNAFTSLTLVNVSNTYLLVSTPLEWGAANWVIKANLESGRIESTGIRLMDDMELRPVGAPSDKGVWDRSTNR